MSEPKQELFNGRLIHFTVGAIIKNAEDQYLIVDRAVEPFGFAAIAGHVDQAESSEQALRREIKEESGLKVVDFKLLVSEFLAENKCSKGVLGHHWDVYSVTVQGQMAKNQREAKSIGWYPLEQLKQLQFEPAWEYWFKKLGIL